jgi:Tol biopolymer transport system component
LGAFTVSETGVLAYQDSSQLLSQLTWFDQSGTRLGTLGDPANHVDVALSPDGSRVATSIMNPEHGTRDLWTFDVRRGLGERFTFDSGDDFAPNWSQPDGERLFFSSLRQASVHLYEKSLRNSSGTETLLQADDLGKFNPHPSNDGRFLLYVAGGGIIARSDIWLLTLSGQRKAEPFIQTALVETQPQFSADSRWVAYTSFRAGRPEVYVTSFPARENETRVSASGGSLPRWNRNGREIFYVAADGTLTVVSVDGGASQFVVGAARSLFRIQAPPARLDAYPYDVTSDGQRILVNALLDQVMPPITLVVNWHAAKE